MNTTANHIRDLKPDPENARRHGARNVGMMVDSLHEVGAGRSIVIDEDGVILAGNGIIEAAAEAGIERVQVVDVDGATIVAVRRSGLSAAQKRRLALFDNRTAELAEWDAEVLKTLNDDGALEGLFKDRELADLLGEKAHAGAEDPGSQDHRGEELRKKWGTDTGQLWRIPSGSVEGQDHKILCGDSTKPEDVAKLMGGERAALMATDPPYLVNYRGGNHPPSWANRESTKRDKHWDDYHEADGPEFFSTFLRVALAEALTENPSIYQWHASRRQTLVEAAWKENGLLWHQTIVWEKARAVLTRCHFLWKFEPCAYGWVQGKEIDRRPPANETNIWQVDQQGENDSIHPTQKPRELFIKPLNWHLPPGGLAFEPFSGSGTTLVAAEQTGRRCYAIEMAPEYVAAALERLAMMGLSPELVEANS